MSFLGEIKRRKVFQVAAVYAVVAWLLIQIVDVVNEPLNLPEWFDTAVIVAFAVGFPIAVILAWAFDLTPEGVVKDTGTAQSSGRRIEYVLIGLLVVAMGWVLYRVEVNPSVEPAVVDSAPTLQVIEEELTSDVLPNSIAVLPFDNLSLDPEDAFIAAGFHESILNQLAKIRDMNVIARTSVMQYENDPPPIPEIAEALRVEMVMEGSVRYASDRILITAQLIDGQTGAHIWSDEYNRDLADIFGVQAEIAGIIAMALEAELSPEEQQSIELASTSSSGAAEQFLKALEAGLSNAEQLRLLDEAIASDPSLAVAYARRAWINGLRFDATEGVQRLELEEKIYQDANKALELDPQLGVALVPLAFMHLRQGRIIDAEATFERAVALSPNDTVVLDRYAVFSYQAGIENYERSAQFARRAVELDPNNAELLDGLGDSLSLSKHTDAAAAYRRALEINSTPQYTGAYKNIGMSEILREDYAEALVAFRFFEFFLRSERQDSAEAFDLEDLIDLAYGYVRIGRSEDADRVITQVRERIAAGALISPLELALFRLAEGNSQEALALIEEAIETSQYGGYRFIQYNLLNDPILDQPEFVEMRSRLGFRE